MPDSGDELQRLRERLQRIETACGGAITSAPIKVEHGKSRRKGMKDVRWTRNYWADFYDGPILYTNAVITFYETGDWDHSCTIEDVSQSSDWDVWVDLIVYSVQSNSYVFTVADNAWFQDIDHDDPPYGQSARGFTAGVRTYFEDIAAGRFNSAMQCHRRRDN